MTVRDIATHEIIEHILKFKLQHLAFLSKDHCKWGHPATYIELYLLIFEKVWRWWLRPSGKKISSEIFSSWKLFGMIHRQFRVKKIRSLEHMVLEYPANHTFWLFSEPARRKKLDGTGTLCGLTFVMGHYFRTWEKILVSGLPTE